LASWYNPYLLQTSKGLPPSFQKIGVMMDPEKIMDGISKEILTALKAMAKSKTPDEKLKQSEIVKNLCDSLGVFLGLLSEMVPYGDEDGPLPF
jgi:hypothetical protein